MGANEIRRPPQAVIVLASGVDGRGAWPSTWLLPQSASGTPILTTETRMLSGCFRSVVSGPYLMATFSAELRLVLPMGRTPRAAVPGAGSWGGLSPSPKSETGSNDLVVRASACAVTT